MANKWLIKMALVSLLFFYGGFNVFTGYNTRYLAGIGKTVTMTDLEYKRLKLEHSRFHSGLPFYLGVTYIIAAICICLGWGGDGWIFCLLGFQFCLFTLFILSALYISWQDFIAPLVFRSLLLHLRAKSV